MRIIPNCCLLLSPGARFVALFVAGSCFLNGACCRYAPRSLSRAISLSLSLSFFLRVPYTNLYFYFLSASLTRTQEGNNISHGWRALSLSFIRWPEK